MTISSPLPSSCPLPRHVAVIGAAGGLGQGILSVCRAENIAFTAVVRSRPERITDLPAGARVVVVTSLAERAALKARCFAERRAFNLNHAASSATAATQFA